jgi:AmmeMemoRadiSam system protein B
MARKPIVAGTFYENDFGKLDEQITKCFKDPKFGPGELPVKTRTKKIIGAVAPHAGYQFSGSCQAWVYKEIGESELPDVFIILGTNHTGDRKSTTLLQDFETPFGIVKIDQDFTKKLIEEGWVVENEITQNQEHSIEVQLPFLQFVQRDHLNKLRIVPIAVSQGANYELFGKTIAKIAKEQNKKICIIASSDFTHYGVNYGYVPFVYSIKESLETLDMGAIDFIKKLDAWSFIDYVNEHKSTICGAYAIAVLIEACKALGAKKAELLQYYTSGELVKDYSNSVSYASIIIS